MANFDEDIKKADDTEDLLKLLENQEKKGNKKSGSMMPFMKSLPIGTIVLVVVIIILGAMVLSLGSNVAALKGEIAEIKNLKSQVADLEGRLEKIIRERDGLKHDIGLVKNELENIKSQRKEAEAKTQLQKKEALKKKQTPEKPRPVAPPPPQRVRR